MGYTHEWLYSFETVEWPKQKKMDSVIFSLVIVFIIEAHAFRYGFANNLQPFM